MRKLASKHAAMECEPVECLMNLGGGGGGGGGGNMSEQDKALVEHF